jgi:hypothetical protein
VTHSEKMARAALKKWLQVYAAQVACEECVAPKDAHCHKHSPEIARLIRATRDILAGGPN